MKKEALKIIDSMLIKPGDENKSELCRLRILVEDLSAENSDEEHSCFTCHSADTKHYSDDDCVFINGFERPASYNEDDEFLVCSFNGKFIGDLEECHCKTCPSYNHN